ncbi:MAG TPA: 7-cyano-7-deazaguanine synthase [Gemmataceae bacterium]|nr:7-cyano-7-deazaguanine synthase [Gemmataceae bacterium]
MISSTPSHAGTMPVEFPPDLTALAILTSGGLDSAVLLAEAMRRDAAVHPIYVRHGLYWETAELNHLRRFLELIACPALQPLEVLEMPVGDLYGNHWSITGQKVPDADSPDEAVFLPGRNLLLLAKVLLWCQLRGVPAVGLASLRGNPFPDATEAFFADYQEIVNRAVQGKVQIIHPYLRLGKVDVLRRGQGLPLEWTFSCLRPVAGQHCGSCNKCAERRRAFAAAGIVDRTPYHREVPCTA